MNMIRVYEEQRAILIKEQDKSYKELKIIQEAGAAMSNKKVTYMNELIDYMMSLDDRIEVLESRIDKTYVTY